MSRLRLADIAAQAGVSQATVSRVINGKGSVAETTRQAVLTAIDVLGFERPEHLRRQAVGLVGLIAPELTNPIFPQFAQEIEGTLAVHGIACVLCTQAPGGVHEDDYTRMLLDRGVAGIVFVNGQHADSLQPPDRYDALRAAGVPMVLINGYSPLIDVPAFSVDDAVGMRIAVEHLAQLGHRRIGLAVGQSRFIPTQNKIHGFTDAVASILDDHEPAIAATSFTADGGGSAAVQLLRLDVSAIIAGSDVMALGAVQAARSLGLKVPEDVSVIGSDDSTLMAYTDPPLTTLRQPLSAISQAAVQALLGQIGGQEMGREDVRFRPRLVIRNSTRIAPGLLTKP